VGDPIRAAARLAFAWPASPDRSDRLCRRAARRRQALGDDRDARGLAAHEPDRERLSHRALGHADRAARAGRWSVGDRLRVRLEIDAAADLPWVVVDDSRAAGLLAPRARLRHRLADRPPVKLLRVPARTPGPSPPTSSARSRAIARTSNGSPPGSWSSSTRSSSTWRGTFQMPPTHVEALYAPEVLGEVPNAAFEIGS
jgi:hypothetical protein